MTRELDVFGVFLPDLLVWVVVAVLISIPVRRTMSALHIYRIVWHRPLFDMAIFILILGGVTTAAHRVLS